MATILIIEDEDLLRRVFSHVLRDIGYEVFSSPNPQHALRTASKTPIDVIVADQALASDLTGLETVEEIQSMDRQVRAILISGHLVDESNVRSSGAVIHSFLHKPVELSDFVAAVALAAR